MEKGRWGHLPVNIENFLYIKNDNCYINKANKILKMNHTCLLRKGITQNKTQSFLSCLADIFNENSMETLKKKIINSIDIDTFVRYNNGALVNIFGSFDIPINIEKYKKSGLYKQIIKKSKTKKKNVIKIKRNNHIRYFKKSNISI